MRSLRIPADNNGTERDIRMIKLRQKISVYLPTLTGAQHFCAIRNEAMGFRPYRRAVDWQLDL
jgi:hypothetical protein